MHCKYNHSNIHIHFYDGVFCPRNYTQQAESFLFMSRIVEYHATGQLIPWGGTYQYENSKLEILTMLGYDYWPGYGPLVVSSSLHLVLRL